MALLSGTEKFAELLAIETEACLCAVRRDLLDTKGLPPVGHGPALLLRSIQTQVDVFLKYTGLFQALLGM